MIRQLYRIAPEGFYAATDDRGDLRVLFSEPFEEPSSDWRFGRPVDRDQTFFLAPILPGKIVGVGRNYAAHARELDNPVPDEPLLFLKSPGSVIGPKVPIVLPPASEKVEFEGEIAVVLRRGLRHASVSEAHWAVLGVTCACDVTARDLQKREPTFARAKSFDTFCPLGPAIAVGVDLDALEVKTRINGEERQHGHASQMIFGISEALSYISRQMTLDAGDVILTGTPSGVGVIRDGDRVEVEIGPVGVLENPVEVWRRD